jgi:alpha-beta hydrolase superfamily lysophospholipase
MSARRIAACRVLLTVALGLALAWGRAAAAPPLVREVRQAISLRGHQQSLYLYGAPGGVPAVVSSGDGGWVHLAPHVAELLASRGYFVVGFDVKAYLSSFTSDHAGVSTEDEPGDFLVLARYAAGETGKAPVLIGVSEGAGLSVLAATDPGTKREIAGVIGLGLPDLNELAWRWRDAVIYLTHKPPHEPLFSAAAVIGQVSPLPLAIIQSTHDEFVSINDTARMLQAAGDPKRLWTIEAADHGFSDNLAEFDRQLLEALAWIDANRPAAR